MTPARGPHREEPQNRCEGTPTPSTVMRGSGPGGGESMRTAIGIARPGGVVGRVGLPQDEKMPASQPAFVGNITVGGGPAPVRAYIAELLPDVLEGTIEPGRVFDRVTNLECVPDGYRAMNEREAIKVMIRL
jgi:threonine dehydrogenase-like Zn-dependent dehydrogenase